MTSDELRGQLRDAQTWGEAVDAALAAADALERCERARAGQASEVIRLKRMIEGMADDNRTLRKRLEEAERACRHAVEHHRTYVDESGVVCISLQSYALIKSVDLAALAAPKEAADQPCPHCSFDPTSLSDYCDKHRPALAAPKEG